MAELAERLAEYASLTARKRDVEDELKCITGQLAAMELPLLEEMGLLGIESTKVNGFTLFTRTDRFVSKRSKKEGVTTEIVCERLKAVGLDYMVSDGYSASSLKSKVCEWLDEGHDVPQPLAEVINVTTKMRLVARKGQ